jgi:hypothetical protein
LLWRRGLWRDDDDDAGDGGAAGNVDSGDGGDEETPDTAEEEGDDGSGNDSAADAVGLLLVTRTRRAPGARRHDGEGRADIQLPLQTEDFDILDVTVGLRRR